MSAYILKFSTLPSHFVRISPNLSVLFVRIVWQFLKLPPPLSADMTVPPNHGVHSPGHPLGCTATRPTTHLPSPHFPGQSRRKGRGRRNARCSHTGSAMLVPLPRRVHGASLLIFPFTWWRGRAHSQTNPPSSSEELGGQGKYTVIVVWYFDEPETHASGLARS